MIFWEVVSSQQNQTATFSFALAQGSTVEHEPSSVCTEQGRVHVYFRDKYHRSSGQGKMNKCSEQHSWNKTLRDGEIE